MLRIVSDVLSLFDEGECIPALQAEQQLAQAGAWPRVPPLPVSQNFSLSLSATPACFYFVPSEHMHAGQRLGQNRT